MKIMVLMLFLVLLVTGAGAETVLVFTMNQIEMPEEPFSDIVRFQSLMEDGVMAVLFDAGHIVFNAGIVRDNPKQDAVPDRLSLRLAKNGGALWLVEIDMHYVVGNDDRRLPHGADYRLYDIMKVDLIIDGYLVMEELRTDEDQSVAKLSEEMGRSIAFDVLRWITDSAIAKKP